MPSIKLPSDALLAVGVVLLAIALGVGIAIASSPGSLSAQTTSSRTPRAVEPSPTASPVPTAKPSVAPSPGPLGTSAVLSAGSRFVLVSSSIGSYISTDAGANWSAIKPPAGAISVVADPSDPNHLIAGGLNLSISRDGGKTWAGTRTAPPRTGPVTPLWINAADGTAWLVVRDSHLIRTRDDGTSWREISDATTLASPLAIAGAVRDEAYVADGPRVIQVDSNGDRVTDRGTLPGGASVKSLAVLSAPTTLLAQGSDGAMYTNASGTTWTRSAAAVAGPVSAVPGKAAWIAADPLSYSTDGGQTWTASSGLPGGMAVLSVASTLDAARVFAYVLTGEVYASTDLGKTWAMAGVPLRP